jgi:AraC-like DNA-binding protein
MKEAEPSTYPESSSDQDFLPDSIQFCSIEEMQEASETDGWSCEYRQFEPGNLKTKLLAGECASISLLDEIASHRVEVSGSSPEGHVSIFAPVGPSRMWVNGQTVDDQSVFLFNSVSDMHVVTDPNTRLLSMHVPISILDETGCSVFDDWNGFGIAHQKINGNAAATTQRIRMLIGAAIHAPVAGRWQKERECDLACSLAALINGSADHPEQHRYTSRRDPADTLRRAIEFIDANLLESFLIGEVCDHASASISKVGRAFQRELGVTPGQYVTARRLVVAREELMRRTPEDTHVARVAMKCGFRHLGRFSGAYHAHFGELPSVTLRSS